MSRPVAVKPFDEACILDTGGHVELVVRLRMCTSTVVGLR